MMEAVLPHMAHDVKGQHIKSCSFSKLPKNHGTFYHIENHFHVLILVVQNDLGFDSFLEIIIRVHEGSKLVNLDLTNDHRADCYY